MSKNPSFLRIVMLFWVVFSLTGREGIKAQTLLKPRHYLLSLMDKENSPFSLDKPSVWLSERAIEKRNRLKILLDERDLPVSPVYLDSLQRMGARVLFQSRWFNSVVVEVADTLLLQDLSGLSFVKEAEMHYPVRGERKEIARKTTQTLFRTNTVLESLQAGWLHEEGFRGENMWIAVLDGGFFHVDRLAAFDCLREEGRVVAVKDFIRPDGDVFEEDAHGMQVLSILAGSDDGSLKGTAPRASYVLLRTEDAGLPEEMVSPESWFEEEAWIAAIEFADSLGVDVVNSSLGYGEFNDSLQNHAPGHMDGHTLRISLAAGMAVEKGMLVVVSAGNEGNKDWKYLLAPADAPGVLSVGAVNSLGEPSPFSSRGWPHYGYIKPDLAVLGESVPLLNPSGFPGRGAGTSFSAPLVSGLAACLWQKFPQFNPMQIIEALRQSASHAQFPDSVVGYGIPDLKKAAEILSAFNESL